MNTTLPTANHVASPRDAIRSLAVEITGGAQRIDWTRVKFSRKNCSNLNLGLEDVVPLYGPRFASLEPNCAPILVSALGQQRTFREVIAMSACP